MFMRFFATLSKFAKIADHYSTVLPPKGENLTKQTLQIGAVRYRRCVTIDIDPEGFYFCIHVVFGKHPQIFIPWKDFRNIQESSIYRKPAKQFLIGEPPVGTIRIPEEIFKKMKNFLVFVLIILCTTVVQARAEAPVIQGQWYIQAVLTATSVPNANVREGHRKDEVWQIQQNGNSATLTTPNGSINGRFVSHTNEFPNGVWYFEAMVPNFMNLANLGAKFEVVIIKRSENVLGGGTTVTYMGNNSFGGPWAPIGLESWRFEATRSR